MYDIAVRGGGITARAVILACRKAGFDRLAWQDEPTSEEPHPAWTLSANLTRVVHALGRGEALLERAYAPNREQVRLARSGYLVSELPLGRFTADRYGAEHLNIEAADLLEALDVTTLVSDVAQVNPTVVVDTRSRQIDDNPTHTLWHAAIEGAPHHANITWLGEQDHAWQFSTPEATHYLFSTRHHEPLQPDAWHRTLQDASTAAAPIQQFTLAAEPTREHWYSGNVVFAGPAAFSGHPYRREAVDLGLEDAWVLGRMLENYEEDFADALAEYERFRRARVQRAARQVAATVQLYDRRGRLGRILRGMNIALAARFLPEIAMQRIDWLYNYDCIRGFR